LSGKWPWPHTHQESKNSIMVSLTVAFLLPADLKASRVLVGP